MMVTFVSECEKKALNKTRRVLDAFANRIGSRTWQTVITNEGLQAVKKLLRKTASKSTAVSCHWIRSRSRSELVWIVGNRGRFNLQGIVPVNRTQKTIMNTQWENDWHYLPLIKSLTALAALFHDWGKASELFQNKLNPKSKNRLKGDPLRHEWISTLFLNAYVNGEKDEQWLTRLTTGEFDLDRLKVVVKKNNKKPLAKLPRAASLLAWLVLSHHRLPLDKDEYWVGEAAEEISVILKRVTKRWGYENKFSEDEFNKNIERCFEYPKGLPSDSDKWLNATKRQARKLRDCLPLLEKALEDGAWRLILHHSRLCLMLGDHLYSSKDKRVKWTSDLDLYANTDRSSGELKQKLDEHLFWVAKKAMSSAHLLPAFENKNGELPHVYDVKPLKRKSPAKFRWQDIAVTKINHWRKEQEKVDAHHFGFFAVNMASTGKGKTFANAKIMQALSPDGESLRYILALGLRTLTLQTGDEYRERIKLENDELAVLIGSRAVMDLHQKNSRKDEEEQEGDHGSGSMEVLLDNDIDFETEIPEEHLTTLLNNTKDRKFLYAPVLSCTIDHLMAATETRRGGRYILPSLRLMSSDLVIDEIDDFDGKDLIAIGRLIHLAGMLGRKVMISSATIPPDLAEGYYNAYQAGWALFSQMRARSPVIGCAWIDEFTAQVHSINCKTDDSGIASYQKYHQGFIDKRITQLRKQQPKHKANIACCEKPESEEVNVRDYYFSVIQQAILEKHQNHHGIDDQTGKHVSFGVVRVANITPCIELTRYLLNAEFPSEIEIRAMAYHSQQILIMRSEQERHLDAVLKRGGGAQAAFDHSLIRNHLNNTSAKNVIFILVATPVEEVGRDHDFDWAVVEPSSYRSFIQLAGRVLRHRNLPDEGLKSPNIALMQYNLKGLLGKQNSVFCRPGYESPEHRLKTHDLKQLVDVAALSERLDAEPRINKPALLKPETNLADLEHQTIHHLLTDYSKQGPESMQGWLAGCWWLTANPQAFVRFREGHPQVLLYLIPNEDDEWQFVEKGQYGEPPITREKMYGIGKNEQLTNQEKQRLWMFRDYETLLLELEKPSLEKTALVYGEIGLPTYGKDPNDLSFVYSSQFGLYKK